jgi:eukaryotic-like serine/threonine-protein kinase
VTLISLKGSEPIPGYQITERLGAGGYGEVWKSDAPGGLHKAVKFIYGYLTDEKASRELKALNRIKQIRHPFLLSLERIEVIEGQLLIVTELADSSLKDRFQACQEMGLSAIPRDEMLDYMRDAADALDFLTANALQHLDVKPENLLVVGGRVKVADFGLVKDIHDRTCSMMGGMTPVYAPPEVFDGRPCSFSDQYSLAIVYTEMVTGMLPFPGNTAAQLASQHLHSRPRLDSLSESDRAVIGRALSKTPTDRFPTAREMVEALRAAGKHGVSSGRPSTTEPRTSPCGDTTSAAGQDTSAAIKPNDDSSALSIRRTPAPRSRNRNGGSGCGSPVQSAGQLERS